MFTRFIGQTFKSTHFSKNLKVSQEMFECLHNLFHWFHWTNSVVHCTLHFSRSLFLTHVLLFYINSNFITDCLNEGFNRAWKKHIAWHELPVLVQINIFFYKNIILKKEWKPRCITMMILRMCFSSSLW